MEKITPRILGEINFMAEIQANASNKSKQAGIAQSKKLSTRVDLTPMVDLGFLLITFFIFTTSLSQPKALKFNTPANGDPTNVGESTSLTFIPTKNNEVIYFHGSLPLAIQNGSYGIASFQPTGGIGDLIRKKKQALQQINKAQDLSIQIYPDQLASYKNIVDILDEMIINNVTIYSLSDDSIAINAAKQLMVVSH